MSPTHTTLVTGGSAAQRELAIAAALNSPAVRPASAAVLLEGIASGTDAFASIQGSPAPHIVRIAPGCLCCTGNLTMRVSLNRLLRQHPQILYISLATSEHLDSIAALLCAPPYTDWLILGEPMHCVGNFQVPAGSNR